jgi:hypothetical protein
MLDGVVVNATPRPLYPRERLGTDCAEGCVGPRAGLDFRLVEWRSTVFEEHLKSTGNRKLRTLFELRNLN